MDISLARAATRPSTFRLSLQPRHALVALLVVVLGWMTLLPVVRLVLGSVTDLETGQLTLGNYARVYLNPSTYDLLANSLIFALGSCAVSFTIGTALAWIIERTDTPFRRFFYTVALVPIIVPGIVTSIAWLFLLSPQIGWLNSVARGAFGLEQPLFNAYSLPGMIWVEGLGTSPLTFLLVSAALKSMDPSLEESASIS